MGHFAVAVVGLALAAWGHLLLRGAPGVVAVWVRMDNLFPPMFRSPPELAGYALFGLGAGLAVAGVVA